MQQLRITLPRLIGSRESADDLLEPLLDDLRGAELLVDCRELLTASPSFADQLVGSSLGEGGAAGLTLLSPPPSFRADIEKAASKRGLASRVTVSDVPTLV